MSAESPATMEPDDSEVLITLVHGTWGRGVFPTLRTSKRPFWFEPGGSFREKLLSDLQTRGVVCSCDAFLWSGANSIFHRDEAAKRLAHQLTHNIERSPRVRQVIIAHSHGGNVTARALGYLDGNVSGFQVCYLATPFMQLFPRTVARTERLIITGAMFFWLLIIGVALGVSLVLASLDAFDVRRYLEKAIWITPIAIMVATLGASGVYVWMASERCRHRNDKLIQATTNLRNNQSHGDVLILRAVDDEASLALAFGTIANLLSARVMSISALLLPVMFIGELLASLFLPDYDFSPTQRSIIAPTIFSTGAIFLVTSLLALVSRGAFGRELIYRPPGTQIDVQSVPDFVRSAKIRTLLREDRRAFFGLRHGIYSHLSASDVVANWICGNAVRTSGTVPSPDRAKDSQNGQRAS
jgi:hypothetical protein